MEVLEIREIQAKDIVVSPRPVWKCRTCPMYGKRPSCPPYAPSWKETIEVMKHYKRAILVKFKIDTSRFEEEKRRVLVWLLNKEKELFREGNYYALALFPGNCNLCEECTFETEGKCKKPEMVRPSIDAIGIELSSIIEIRFNEPVLYGMILVD
ncbi:DUF2284 domain-containing protein [Pyrococcus abyssi]|uniref:Metal-binding protein n=1 Tax=Pyrococcus abyssi (strain GE5 / Orsay) TaxID=272844 RepID=Q9V0G2_PYRAB|nr:DUF2284 domain-containing protein [Pyrococcus abyssi]CAB49741.1 Hypothetical protein PAB1808 [Pyrococcus abyssi GE5]CCE70229.1 TPA: hypothetical protein PAB1808 [Pyrococcus abyssi GE5]